LPPAELDVGLLQLALSVDTSVVNVALPRIHSALGFSATGLSWVITAYALAFGGLVLLSRPDRRDHRTAPRPAARDGRLRRRVRARRPGLVVQRASRTW
jgi:MFS family permease